MPEYNIAVSHMHVGPDTTVIKILSFGNVSSHFFHNGPPTFSINSLHTNAEEILTFGSIVCFCSNRTVTQVSGIALRNNVR